VRDGDEKGLVEVVVDSTGGKESPKATLKVGMKDLLGMFPFLGFFSHETDSGVVLKTSGSAFENFHRDEFTTLVGMFSLISGSR